MWGTLSATECQPMGPSAKETAANFRLADKTAWSSRSHSPPHWKSETLTAELQLGGGGRGRGSFKRKSLPPTFPCIVHNNLTLEKLSTNSKAYISPNPRQYPRKIEAFNTSCSR